jgi:MFS family permease
MTVPDEDRWTRLTLGVAIACGVGNIVSSTAIINSTFSAFLIPVTQSLRWSRSQFSFVLTIISLVGLFAYPLAGRAMDRFGARPVVLTGNILFGLTIIAASLMPPITWVVYGLFAVMGVTAAMPSTVLLARVTSSWFHRRRGLALGLTAGVALGIGCTAMPLISQALIDWGGWRTAYRGLGLLVVLLGFPVMFAFLREAPGFAQRDATDHLPGLTLAEALRTRPFWILLVSVALGAGSLVAVATHAAALIQENELDAGTAAWMLAAMSATNACWQLVLGRLLDRSHAPRIAAPFLAFAVGGVMLVGRSSDATTVIAAGVLMGIGSGTEYGVLPYCLSRYFGFRSYGQIYGTIFGSMMLVMGTMPFVMDLLYERFGSYRPVLWMLGGGLLFCGGLLALLPTYTFAARPQRADAAPGPAVAELG